jgi:hypothetical protein
MSFRNAIAEEFRRAANDPANIENGVVNWDFVEADVMIELTVDTIIEEMGSLEAFYPYFNELVFEHQLALETA